MEKLDNLNKNQLEATMYNDNSLLVVAGAGTGKTRLITNKIVHLLNKGYKEDQILGLTFTNKAAEEMQERIKKLVENKNTPVIGTFHSFGAQLLREYGESVDVKKNFTIADRDDSRKIIRRLLKREDIKTFSPRVIHSALSDHKKGNLSEDSKITEIIGTILPYYEKSLAEENSLDFEDLLIKSVLLLQKDLKVREKLQNKYKFILIDEFQDTDAIQNKLILLLKGTDTKIIAVGDSDQTIYSWRGADINHMLCFEEVFKPAKTIILDKNYRSTKTILDAANRLISKNKLRQEKILKTDNEYGNPIEFFSAKNEEEESQTIAERVKEFMDNGVKLDDIVILYRANFQARAIESSMLINKIPYKVIGVRFFERAEIKDLLSYIKLARNSSAMEAYIRASKVPQRGIGAKTLGYIRENRREKISGKIMEKVKHFEEEINLVRDDLKKFSIKDSLQNLIKRISYEEYIMKMYENPRDRANEVNELISFSDRFSHLSGEDGADMLLQEASLGSDQDDLRDKKYGVRLMTIHSAKGLEFSTVFLTGMEDGLFPYGDTVYEKKDEEEERRLCYVAITRAKKNLICSFAMKRSFFGKNNYTRPSRFLSDILEDSIMYEEPTIY